MILDTDVTCFGTSYSRRSVIWRWQHDPQRVRHRFQREGLFWSWCRWRRPPSLRLTVLTGHTYPSALALPGGRDFQPSCCLPLLGRGQATAPQSCSYGNGSTRITGLSCLQFKGSVNKWLTRHPCGLRRPCSFSLRELSSCLPFSLPFRKSDVYRSRNSTLIDSSLWSVYFPSWKPSAASIQLCLGMHVLNAAGFVCSTLGLGSGILKWSSEAVPPLTSTGARAGQHSLFRKLPQT